MRGENFEYVSLFILVRLTRDINSQFLGSPEGEGGEGSQERDCRGGALASLINRYIMYTVPHTVYCINMYMTIYV